MKRHTAVTAGCAASLYLPYPKRVFTPFAVALPETTGPLSFRKVLMRRVRPGRCFVANVVMDCARSRGGMTLEACGSEACGAR